MNGTSAAGSIAYHISRNGEVSGPFSEGELRAGVENGQFATTDLVHATGQTDWQPLEEVLNAIPQQPKVAVSKGNEVPEWRDLGKWALARLRLDIAERGLATGGIFLLLGLVSLGLSRWPVLFSAPWLVISVITAVVLLRSGRKATGGILLAATFLLPWVLHHYTSNGHSEKAKPVVQDEPAELRPADTSPTKSSTVAMATPTPISQLDLTVKTPASQPSVSLPATPAPAPAPAVIAGRTGVQMPGDPTPVPESFLSKAGKMADTVVPYLNRAVDALPKLSDFASKPAPNTPVPVTDTWTPDSLVGHEDSIFVVKNGVNTVGNGFACRAGGKAWLFTNTHILASTTQPTFTAANGGTVVPGVPEIAPGPDVARFALDKPPAHAFEAVTNLESTVQIGDAVIAFGNNSAGNLVLSWQGVVKGVGPDKVEVSAAFLPAYTGAPVVHVKSRKVIGVACATWRPYDVFTASNPANGTTLGRHFAYRIDRPMAWEAVNPTEFQAEANRLDQVSKLTEDIDKLRFSLRTNGDLDINSEALRSATAEWKQKINRRGFSEADRISAGQSYLSALRFVTRADVKALDGYLSYTFFREQLASEKKVRDQLLQALEVVLQSMPH